MPKQTINILQITDMHLFADIKRDLLGVVTYDSFRAVVKHATKTLTKYSPQLIVLSGDLSQDDSEDAYSHLLNTISHFPQPIAWMPGNHDKPKLMEQVFAHSRLTHDKHFILGNWQIILLDTHWPNHVSGQLSAKQLHFLDNTLSNSKQHALIFLHHHVLPLHTDWLDPLNLQNNQAFLAILDKHSWVRGVVCGHVHQDSSIERKGIPFISTPSTCIQFKPLSRDFALDSQMPGYRYLHLEADGSLHTTLYRLEADKQFLPDMQSQGY
ncbi:MAG: cpdA [Gammaproteobacteria bacterium]|nr:cpdA [Gammaproteobacteria bacterium]